MAKKQIVTELITHNGTAHRDEFLCACILLHLHPHAVLHRVGTVRQSQLEDPAVIVFDIGGQHDEALNNFDHHQGGFEYNECALTLILRKLGMEEIARKSWPWLGMSEFIDNHGINAAAAKANIPLPTMMQTTSPVEHSMLRMFSKTNTLRSGTLRQMMKDIGTSLMESVQRERRLIEMDLDSLDMFELSPGIRGIYHTEDLSPTEINRAMKYKQQPPLAIVTFPNARGAGTTCVRTQPFEQMLDFRAMKDDPSLEFVHAAGFMAVCKDANPREFLKRLVAKCLPANNVNWTNNP